MYTLYSLKIKCYIFGLIISGLKVLYKVFYYKTHKTQKNIPLPILIELRLLGLFEPINKTLLFLKKILGFHDYILILECLTIL